MYEAVTRGIRVRVSPQHLQDQSSPEEEQFFRAYTIDIIDERSETVRLRSRYWRIADATATRREVRGPRVIGNTPVLAPGGSFRCSHQMTGETGEPFNVAVPAFLLDSSHAKRSLS
jgi:ApaG protein